MSIADVKIIKKNPENLIIADQLLEILQDLIRIPSPSGYEEKIADYLVNFGKKYSSWKIERDKINNVFFIPIDSEDQELPLLMAHSDTVHNNKPELLENVEIVNKYSNDGLICDYSDRQLGYDDKCGIAIILWLIANRPNLKFRAIITVQEEGCKDKKSPLRKYGRGGGCGIQNAIENNPDFFRSSWGLLLDRAEDKNPPGQHPLCEIRENESDIIWKYNPENYPTELCREKFIEQIEIFTKKELHTPMLRAVSPFKADAMNIKRDKKTERIALVNLATGFYNEHETNDYVNIFQVVRTFRVVEKCLEHDKELAKIARED